MGYQLSGNDGEEIFRSWTKKYDVFAPMLFEGEGCFSDTDIIRYGNPQSLSDIVWDKKSDYSFKEVLLRIHEVLFYFTEDQTTVPKGPEKDILVFLRACDLHAVKRLDEIYLNNGFEDFYYRRVRDRVKFVLMGCGGTCDSGFCASMGTNKAENYDLYIKAEEERVLFDVKDEALEADIQAVGSRDAVQDGEAGENGEIAEARQASESAETRILDVEPDFAAENKEKVTLPENLSNESFTKAIWKEYGDRCIGCGRCNFVCPTCTCFTMQDIFYKENPKAGERRRVWASCQVDGYTSMAGGHEYRKDQGDRMRFKVMHKIYDYEKRFGYPMCVGCGRCDDVCPEYISYSNCVNRLAKEEA